MDSLRLNYFELLVPQCPVMLGLAAFGRSLRVLQKDTDAGM
ncbi:hypothetical protein [Undibacterium sp. MH2W]